MVATTSDGGMMAKKGRNKGGKKAWPLKNPLPLALLALLALALAAILFLFYNPAGAQPQQNESALQAGCTDGQTKACSVGECGGTSTCVNGRWWVCRWETVCTPGSRIPCLNGGCAYAVRECNSCGTGYGPCFGPANSS